MLLIISVNLQILHIFDKKIACTYLILFPGNMCGKHGQEYYFHGNNIASRIIKCILKAYLRHSKVIVASSHFFLVESKSSA